MSTLKYYDVRDTLKECPNASAVYVFGQGGVGKSYSIKRLLALTYLKENKRFIYVKRYTTEFQNNALDSVFSDVSEDPEFIEAWEESPLSKGYYRAHIMQRGAWFVIKGEKADGSLHEVAKIGRIVAVSQATRFKGGVYNDSKYVFFDEFITEDGYVRGDKEPELFSKILGTVGRKEGNANDVVAFFAGNPDASIEANPYLYPLQLDYARMDANTVYKYDTVEPDGHRIADNIAVIKLANFNGQTFISSKVGYLMGNGEEAARMRGDVKTNRYINIDVEENGFKPYYELIVETPVITNTEYHKKIYCYLGELWNERILYIAGHKRYNTKGALYCRYDAYDFRKRDIPQTYRLNIPPSEELADVRSHLANVYATRLIVTTNNALATLFEQIKLNS